MSNILASMPDMGEWESGQQLTAFFWKTRGKFSQVPAAPSKLNLNVKLYSLYGISVFLSCAQMSSILAVVAFLVVVSNVQTHRQHFGGGLWTIVPNHRQAFLKFLSISHLLRHLAAIQIGQSTWFQVTNNLAFYPQLCILKHKGSIDSRVWRDRP